MACEALSTAVSTFVKRQEKKLFQKDTNKNNEMLRLTFRRHSRTAKSIANHACYLLRTLVIKRRSLENATRAFSALSQTCVHRLRQELRQQTISASASDSYTTDHSKRTKIITTIQTILHFWLAQYIRLRDGIILLCTGECRHPADIAAYSKANINATTKKQEQNNHKHENKYQSKLGGVESKRTDGYTALYSASGGYSGFGYDEFYDDAVGLKSRLIHSLLSLLAVDDSDDNNKPRVDTENDSRRNKIWERLLEDYGAEVYENTLDSHYVELKNAERELEGTRVAFVNNLNTSFENYHRSCVLGNKGASPSSSSSSRGGGGGGGGAGRIIMTTEDKFERVELVDATMLGISTLRIERRADNFKVLDPNGVLPDGMDEKGWECAMRLPRRHGSPTLSSTSSSSSSTTTATTKRGSEGATVEKSRKRRRLIIEDSSSSSDDNNDDRDDHHQNDVHVAIHGVSPAGSTSNNESGASAQSRKSNPKENHHRIAGEKTRRADDSKRRTADEAGGDESQSAAARTPTTHARDTGSERNRERNPTPSTGGGGGRNGKNTPGGEISNADTPKNHFGVMEGLKIQIKTTTKTTTTTTTTNADTNDKEQQDDERENHRTSLVDIKTEFGVDARKLQLSREELEADERGELTAHGGGIGDDDDVVNGRQGTFEGGGSSTKFVTRDVVASSRKRKDGALMEHEKDMMEEEEEEISDLTEEMEQTRAEIRLYRTILARVRDGDDQFEIWDARECLRENLMTMGNHLLSMHSILHGGDDDKGGTAQKSASGSKLLKDAEASFEESITLVKEQEELHRKMSMSETENQSEETESIRRNLLLLRGRALVNRGIALVKQALMECNPSSDSPSDRKDVARRTSRSQKRDTLLRKGIEALKASEECARAMRGRTVAASNTGKPRMHQRSVTLDRLNANQLECLACRWRGSALWNLGMRKEAVTALEKAAGLCRIEEMTPPTYAGGCSGDVEVAEEYLLFQVECYYAASVLVDLSKTAVEITPVFSRRDSRREASLVKGDQFVSWACKGYELAGAVSNDIMSLCNHPKSHFSFADLKVEHELSSKEELMGYMNDMRKLWEERKTKLQSTIGQNLNSPANTPSVPRRDLFRNASIIPTHAPTNRITLPDGSVRSRQRGDVSHERGAIGKYGSSSQQARHRFHAAFCSGGEFGDGFTEDGMESREEPMVFRKWGDELLPQVELEGGGTTVKLAYPTLAPPMPPDALTSSSMT